MLMCARSQFVSVLELWNGFNPLGIKKGQFVLAKGYIDESFGAERNAFALACVISTGKNWSEIERKWKLHLKAKNRELEKAGRPLISRYHASDCSGRKGDFNGWTLDERDRFVLGLFQVFRQVSTFTVAFDTQMDEICEVFPEVADRLEAAYYWLTRFAMLQIGSDCGAGNRYTLFHERTGGNGKYDPTILRAFNQLKSDPTFRYRDSFVTIAPVGWEDCIALQPVDLVAFECYKQAEARLAARKSRRSFTALLNLDAFGIHSKTVNKAALVRLKEMVESAKARQSK